MTRATCCLGLLTIAVLCGTGHAWSDEPATKPAEKKEEPAKKPTKANVALLKLAGSYGEGATANDSPFGAVSVHLRDMRERLEKAKKDDKVQAIVLQLRGLEIGRAKVNEFRTAIYKARQSGKRIIAQLEEADGPDYLVATACDEIIMPESGAFMVTGIRAEMTYMKGLFDKLGIQADFIQIGDFKGASESYTRTGMSPEFRQQFEKVIDDYYEQLVMTISESRKLDPQKVRELLDEGLLSAHKAKAAGLIDRLAYEDEMKADLTQRLKVDEVALLRDYAKPEVDTDFSGFSGMMKMMDLMLNGDKSKKPSRNRKIAVIYAVGAITGGDSGGGLFGGQSVGSDTLVKALREAEEDPKTLGIVLRVDSPGGSATASDLIWRQLKQSKKPVVASMGDTAASGGYYISVGCQKIFAEPGTLTGSIGVVGGKLAMKGLLDKVGVTTDVISRGKNSGVMSSIHPFSDSERNTWKSVMTECYDQFKQKVAAGRKMDVNKVHELAQGKLYSGRMAKQVGLVDEIGTLEDAIAAVKVMAGLKADEPLEIWQLPKSGNPFAGMFDLPGLQAPATQIRAVAPEIASPLAEVELWQKVFKDPAVTILPFQVRIR